MVLVLNLLYRFLKLKNSSSLANRYIGIKKIKIKKYIILTFIFTIWIN